MKMATTKIWAVKDSLSRVVNYASNPEKTIFNDLKQVLIYAENYEKTVDKNEKTMYVTGVNCNRETAFEEMKRTQKQFGKCTGNIAYHAYQSFKTGEVSPEMAHEIGVKLARKMWGEHQVIVATHFNTGTYHNHFVVNSVNMFTGKKFNCNKGAYYRFRGLSDELCAENNLTVIKNPKGITPRNLYFAEKRGEPTKYNLMRKAIDEAKEMCLSYKQFKEVMLKKGYIINDDYNRKYVTIRSINDKKATRLYQLGEDYQIPKIMEKINRNPYYKQEQYYNFVRPKRNYKQYKTRKFNGNFKNISKMTGLDVLFLLLFRLMGVYQKRRCREPLSPEMKREVRKMERYSNEIKLITNEDLKTIEDVQSYISQTESKIAEVTAIRQKYRNKLRFCTDEKLTEEYKSKRNDCTAILKDYRNKLKTANQIIEDNPKIKEVIEIEKQARNEKLQKPKIKYRDRGAR